MHRHDTFRGDAELRYALPLAFFCLKMSKGKIHDTILKGREVMNTCKKALRRFEPKLRAAGFKHKATKRKHTRQQKKLILKKEMEQ